MTGPTEATTVRENAVENPSSAALNTFSVQHQDVKL